MDPTHIIRYVNTNSTAGGDGTTNATTGANRAYASAEEWEAAEQTDLVTADQRHTVWCSGGVDINNSFYISGWTCDATHYLTMGGNPDTADGRNYSAVFSDNHYHVHDDDYGTHMSISVVSYVRIIGLQIGGAPNAGGNGRVGLYALHAGSLLVEGCHIDVRTNGTNWRCMQLLGITYLAKVRNNVLNGNGNTTMRGIWNNISSNTNYFSNNHIVNCNIGVESTSVNAILKNNVVYNCTTAYNGLTAGSDNNSTDNAETTGGASDRQSQTFSFVDAAGGDYSLLESDTGALNHGANLRTDPNNPVTEDLRSVSRPQGPAYDIGAFETVPSAGYGGSYGSSYAFGLGVGLRGGRAYS